MSGDLLMFVGKEHYPWPNDFSDEAIRVGVSKRVSRNSIPEIEPGVTRLALIHPKAIVKVTAEGMLLCDLAWELAAEHSIDRVGHETDQDMYEYVTQHLICLEEHQSTSGLTRLLRRAEKAKDLKRLEEKYGIEYHAGVFGWAPLTAVHYVALAWDKEIPDDLKGVQGIKMVVVDYSEEAVDE